MMCKNKYFNVLYSLFISLALFAWNDAIASEEIMPTPYSGSGVPAIKPSVDTGSEVYYPSGTYNFAETDLSIAARSIPMVWERTYRSNWVEKKGKTNAFGLPQDGPLGFGWYSPFFQRIEGNRYVSGDGRDIVFQADANGNFLTDMSSGYSLQKTLDGYELKQKGGNTKTFNAEGKLTGIIDSRGHKATLQYNSEGKLNTIKDVMDRTIFTFTNSTSHGRITSVTDLAGRAVNYEYDADGNLVKVMHPAAATGKPAPVYEYTYNTYHGMTSKTNPVGEKYLIEYVTNWTDRGIVNRVIDPEGVKMMDKGEEPLGHQITFQYDFGNRVYKYTDYNGNLFVATVNTKGQVTSISEERNGTTIPLKKVEYKDGNVELTTDSVGNTTTVRKDEWGNIVSRIDGEGNEWKYVYNSDKKLLTETDPLGTVTKYEYDSYGNQTKEVKSSGTTDEVITAYTYSDWNEITSIVVDSANISAQYDNAGNVVKLTNPLGNIKHMEYDEVGNLTTTVDFDGVRSEFSYDNRGNLLNTKDALGYVTAYSYNVVNRMIVEIDPKGNTTKYEYDFRDRVTAVIAPLNNRETWKYDGNGNIIEQTGVAGNKKLVTYDSSNRMSSVTDAEGNTQSYIFELVGEASCGCGGGSASLPASVRDPVGNVTQYAFDRNGRIIAVTDAMGGITKYLYDANGNLTKVTDSRGNSTIYAYDRLNRLVKIISPDTGTTTYVYDKRGSMISKVDAKELTLLYEYDASRRLLEVKYPDSRENITFTYDKRNLIKMTDQSGITTYKYDAKGRMIKKVDTIESIAYTTEYSYDAVGNISTMTYSSGKIVTYSYDNTNRVSAITLNGQPVADKIGYTANGLLASITYGNGIAETRMYDKNDNLNEILSSVLNKAYNYDGVGNITKITDKINSAKTQSFTYDGLYRLVLAKGSYGDQNFEYDSVGNRTKLIESGVGETYRYAASNNQLHSVTKGNESVQYAFDANGNAMVEDEREYIYNQNQRLIKVIEENTTKGEYVYNGSDQRVKKITENGAVIFHYDVEGNLITETTETGNLISEYIYLYNKPYAKVEGKQIYYYHNDHLGTPQKLTDDNKSVIWNGEYKPFGEAMSITGSVTNNLKFPGQYYDKETGLHYNYFRDYNPETGRYIEADSIGIIDGMNHLFVYVENDPVNWIDPWGDKKKKKKKKNAIKPAKPKPPAKPRPKWIPTQPPPAKRPIRTPKRPGLGCRSMLTACLRVLCGPCPPGPLKMGCGAICISAYIGCLGLGGY